jgi:chromate transport protein ChrA
MKPFTTLAAIVFAIMALVHLYRLIWGLEIVVQGHSVPQWVSAVGLIVAAILALMVWRESRRS